MQGAPLEPKPLQSSMPLMIGGGGEKVTLKIAAKYADEWNVWGNVETLVRKMSILDQHCEGLNRDPATLERCAVALLFLSDNEDYLSRVRDSAPADRSIIGGINEVRDIVAGYSEAGVKELIIPDFTLGTLIGADQKKRDLMEKFITEVATVVA